MYKISNPKKLAEMLSARYFLFWNFFTTEFIIYRKFCVHSLKDENLLSAKMFPNSKIQNVYLSNDNPDLKSIFTN
jgi:hypothetical protein